MKIKKLIKRLSMYDGQARVLVHLDKNWNSCIVAKVRKVTEAENDEPGLVVSIQGEQLEWLQKLAPLQEEPDEEIVFSIACQMLERIRPIDEDDARHYFKALAGIYSDWLEQVNAA